MGDPKFRLLVVGSIKEFFSQSQWPKLIDLMDNESIRNFVSVCFAMADRYLIEQFMGIRQGMILIQITIEGWINQGCGRNTCGFLSKWKRLMSGLMELLFFRLLKACSHAGLVDEAHIYTFLV
ncbi:hypothetical protein H5410_018952 [Solanum commersonii]|uniref:Uncharacterized protein n=1 Tax=Solanum commersonii TaxID=4109 RepID=A0A9J6A3Z4_SOLCO|nr:hypothetical protein H5410_018952 [Solanum commersonii]